MGTMQMKCKRYPWRREPLNAKGRGNNHSAGIGGGVEEGKRVTSKGL